MNYHPENIEYTGVLHEKDGVYKTHYTNGAIKSLKSYKAGKLHGLCQTYDLYGNILAEFSYKEGMLHGYVKIYHTPKYTCTVQPRLHKIIAYENNVKIGLERVFESYED
jgi:antitoxin component YwqK of YwqJK toxin-antitoxin module